MIALTDWDRQLDRLEKLPLRPDTALSRRRSDQVGYLRRRLREEQR